MHKKTFFLLIALVVLAGLLFFLQIRRSQKITVTHNPVALISEKSTFIPIANDDMILGNPGAAITIVEFMDLGCKECLLSHAIIKSAVSRHPQEMRLVWKDAPQQKLFTKDRSIAHRAAWCAGQQNSKKFWEFIDAVSQNTNDLEEPDLKKIAVDLNLDPEILWHCANGEMAKKKIAASAQLFEELGLKSLPIIFVNNKLINTRAEVDLKEMLENFIAK